MNATGARGRPRGLGARPRRTISPSSSGSNNGGAASESSAWPSLGGASTWVARTTSSAVSGSGGSRGSGSRSGSSSRSGTGPRLSPPASVPASARAAAVAGRRAMVALRLSVERRTARPVPAIPAPVTRTRLARVAPVTRISPATRRNTARMSAPRAESRCELDPELGLADDAAAPLEGRSVPELRVGHRPGPDAQRAGGQHQRQGRHQADEPGAQRAARAGAVRA